MKNQTFLDSNQKNDKIFMLLKGQVMLFESNNNRLNKMFLDF